MAVLVCYGVESGLHANTVFQAVLIAYESAATRGKKTDRLWKQVFPLETQFVWLLRNITWTFCSDILRKAKRLPISGFLGDTHGDCMIDAPSR